MSKLSKERKRSPRTLETKEKLRVANLGKKLSEAHKKRLSDVKRGKPGKPHTIETRTKLSEITKAINRPKTLEEIQRISLVGKKNKGKVRTPEMRAKVSAGLKLYYQKNTHHAILK